MATKLVTALDDIGCIQYHPGLVKLGVTTRRQLGELGEDNIGPLKARLIHKKKLCKLMQEVGRGASVNRAMATRGRRCSRAHAVGAGVGTATPGGSRHVPNALAMPNENQLGDRPLLRWWWS